MINPKEAIIIQTIGRIEQGQWSFDQWPLERVARFAEQVAISRPLGWYPAWYVGILGLFEDAGCRLRRRLWEHLVQQEAAPAFLMDWSTQPAVKVWIFPGNKRCEYLFVFGSYEPNLLALLNLLIQSGMVVFDVGADCGLHTLFTAARVGRAGLVLALEANPQEFAHLQRNLAVNQMDNVRALQPGGGSQGDQPANNLDELAGREDIAKVDLIRVGAGGGKFAVLEGARLLLEQHHPVLLVEMGDTVFTPRTEDQQNVLGLLESLGYLVYIFDPCTGRLGLGNSSTEYDKNIVAIHRTQRHRVFRSLGEIK